MGVVIAYQGGTALQTFGANIYLVNLLAITMLREMAPLLTAIIVAGRTGSSYAAQIGTMRITEEVDALRTLGITPLEMLALPKLIALVIALPLLTVWADALGLLGGMLVSNTFYGISAANFLNRLPEAVWPSTFWVGLVKTPVFAVLITIIGCYQGLKVRGSAEEVGQATTASVVQAIFLVIIADAFFSIAFQQVGL
jgi:phospholipid/cholesterol/gamma-HCH transport system permease protein